MGKSEAIINAAFLDRDGVLITNTRHRTNRDHLELLPGVAQAIKRLNEQKIPVIVITNQSVIGRGLCSERDVEKIHLAIQDILGEKKAHITRFYYCPHHASEAKGDYKIDCECRKPKPGMLIQASHDHSIDLSGSIMVGDKFTDIRAGINAGCRTVLISNNYTRKIAADNTPQPDHSAPGLDLAVDWILDNLETNSRQTESGT